MHGQGLPLEGIQYDSEAARSTRRFHLVRHDPSDTGACNGCLHRGLRCVHGQSRPNWSVVSISATDELPTSRHPCLIDRNAVVVGKIIRRLRTPTSSKIFWTRAGDDTNGSNASRDHAAVWKRPNTNGHVDLILNGIQDAIAEQETQSDIRVNVEELAREGKQVKMPEAPR